MRRRELLGSVVAGAVSVVLAGCAGPPPAPAEMVTLGATGRPGRRRLDGDATAVELFEQRDDLVNLDERPWEFWAEETPGVLIIGVIGGIFEATGAVAEVQELPTTVGIGIGIGYRPDAGTVQAIAVTGAVRVVLSAPVGDRTVVDLNA